MLGVCLTVRVLTEQAGALMDLCPSFGSERESFSISGAIFSRPCPRPTGNFFRLVDTSLLKKKRKKKVACILLLLFIYFNIYLSIYLFLLRGSIKVALAAHSLRHWIQFDDKLPTSIIAGCSKNSLVWHTLLCTNR